MQFSFVYLCLSRGNVVSIGITSSLHCLLRQTSSSKDFRLLLIGMVRHTLVFSTGSPFVAMFANGIRFRLSRALRYLIEPTYWCFVGGFCSAGTTEKNKFLMNNQRIKASRQFPEPDQFELQNTKLSNIFLNNKIVKLNWQTNLVK